MRTTLVIDDDVLDRARAVALKIHEPFRQVINAALRSGLEAAEAPAKRRSFHTHPHKMGLKPGRNLDNVQELFPS
jgi:hypothetical protein